MAVTATQTKYVVMENEGTISLSLTWHNHIQQIKIMKAISKTEVLTFPGERIAALKHILLSRCKEHK